ncbi:hypothetical protein DPSP01_009592 [Paraphaeosphaeria sporulosa]
MRQGQRDRHADHWFAGHRKVSPSTRPKEHGVKAMPWLSHICLNSPCAAFLRYFLRSAHVPFRMSKLNLSSRGGAIFKTPTLIHVTDTPISSCQSCGSVSPEKNCLRTAWSALHM